MHRRILNLLAPLLARTPLLTWLLRLWGAKLGSGVLVDGGAGLEDLPLLTVGRRTKLGHGVMAAGAMVVPAGIVHPTRQALVLSPVGGRRGGAAELPSTEAGRPTAAGGPNFDA